MLTGWIQIVLFVAAAVGFLWAVSGWTKEREHEFELIHKDLLFIRATVEQNKNTGAEFRKRQTHVMESHEKRHDVVEDKLHGIDSRVSRLEGKGD